MHSRTFDLVLMMPLSLTLASEPITCPQFSLKSLMVCSKGLIFNFGYEFSVLLSIPLDYALYLLPEGQRGHAGVVVGYHLSGHTVHYEFGEVPWDLVHQIISVSYRASVLYLRYLYTAQVLGPLISDFSKRGNCAQNLSLMSFLMSELVAGSCDRNWSQGKARISKPLFLNSLWRSTS